MSTTITALTPEQSAMLPVYRDKGIAVGRSAGRPLPSNAILLSRFAAIYKEADLPAPTTVLTVGSPYAGSIAAALLVKSVDAATLMSFTTSSPDVAAVLDLLQRQLRELGYLPSRVSKIITKEELPLQEQRYTCGYGSHDSYWLTTYDYFYSELGVTTTPSLKPLINGTLDIGWYWPFAGVVIVSPVPEVVHLDEQGNLHKDLGPALSYPDGFSVYTLHGIRMAADKVRLVTTPAKDLTPQDILMEPNADIRRELVRKVGPALMADKIPFTVLHAATVDIDYNYAKDANGFMSRGKSVAIMKNTYALLGLDTSAIRTIRKSHPYQLVQFILRDTVYKALRMENPSIAATHIEFVSRTCNTVEDAIAFRAQRLGGREELPDGGIPVVLT